MARRLAEMPPRHPMPATLECRSMMHGIVTLEMSGGLPRAEPDAIAAAVRLFVGGLGAGGE
ncbi:MAG: WHG domain-containing protein [Methylocella sp.]